MRWLAHVARVAARFGMETIAERIAANVVGVFVLTVAAWVVLAAIAGFEACRRFILVPALALAMVCGLASCGGLLVLPPLEDGGAPDAGAIDTAPLYGPRCPFDTLRESEMHDCGPLAGGWRCDVYSGPVLPDGGCAWPGSPRFLVRSCDQCPWPSDAGKAVR